MSNHDYIIANAVGATVRADINDALAAIASNNSSATEPATMYAYQWWVDTTSGLLKQRNAANSAWITIGTLASTNLGLALVGGSATQAFLTAALTASGLVDISGASAGQIKFPATQNASADANTLDDYEEGTWTLVVTPSAGAITSYSTTYTVYTKIGRLVNVQGTATITNNGTGSGSLTFAGLPFTSSFATVFCGRETNATNKTLSGALGASSTSISQVAFYDNTYPGATGNVVSLNGCYTNG